MARRTSSGWMTAGLASRGRRLVSAAVAVVIGVAFLALSLATITTAQRGMQDTVAAGLRDADLVVTGTDGAWLESTTYDGIAALPGVAGVRGETSVSAETTTRDWVHGTSVPAAGVTLLAGEMPHAEGEVLANADLAEAHEVGDELRLLTPTGDGALDRAVTVTIAGVADFGPMNALSFGPGFAAADATLRSIDPQLGYQTVLLDLADGADPDGVREAVAGVAPDAVVQTGPQAAEARVASLTGDTNVLAAILLGFGAVALATAAIVIANTFTITLAQRTGELALLRAVGATVAQVRRQVLLEAALLGLLASAAGVALGLLGSWGLVVLAGRLDLGVPLADGVAVTPLVVAVPLLVGLVVTVLASLWPAVRATRVSPLAALRPAGQAGGQRRVGWVRLGLAVLMLGGGTALMLYAAGQRDVLSGVAGGLVSFVGVLVAAVVVVPAAVRALGLGARLVGAPGRLAVDNAVRNRGRAASTSAALLVGVTLITMTSIGAASAERTALGEIDSAYAVDFAVTSGSEYVEADDPSAPGAGERASRVVTVPLGAGVQPALAAVDGVRAARAVDTAYLTLGDDLLTDTRVLGLDPARDGDVVRSPTLADLEPGTLGMGSAMLTMVGLEEGGTVTVRGPEGSADLRVVALAVGYDLAVNRTDLATLGGGTVAPGAVLVGLDDDADVGEVLGGVQEVADTEGLAVSGAAVERALITKVLDILVLVTTALLGVAVVIAVVGIANTLSLSVVERHREHALLRGLGLTRGQMRGMLLTEGVLLAVVSAALGLLLGVGYAVLGIQTVLPEGTAVQLDVPWATVGAIVAVALLAGALASVLPARRAARVSPAEGL
ncbi:MAG: ABC transporter permease, partial [Acidobacteria bacterium]